VFPDSGQDGDAYLYLWIMILQLSCYYFPPHMQ